MAEDEKKGVGFYGAGIDGSPRRFYPSLGSQRIGPATSGLCFPTADGNLDLSSYPWNLGGKGRKNREGAVLLVSGITQDIRFYITYY